MMKKQTKNHEHAKHAKNADRREHFEKTQCRWDQRLTGRKLKMIKEQLGQHENKVRENLAP